MKVILRTLAILSSVVILSLSAPYPTVTYTFNPNTLAKASEINANFSNILSAFSDGSKRHNFYELYINSNLAIDTLRNATLKTLYLTETMSVSGNAVFSGTISVPTLSVTSMTLGSTTITNATITTATITSLTASTGTITTLSATSVNINNESVNSSLITTATITNLNSTTINASIISILQRYIDKSGQVMPVGSILAYGGISAPTGWFLCDGTTKDKTTYSDLFSAISGNFGVTGNAFYLPDFRGRFLRGLDSVTVSRDPDALTRTAMNEGGNVSRNIGSIQDDGIQFTSYTGASSSDDPSETGTISAKLPSADTPTTTGNETRPINAYVNYIIKW